jgi:methyl-accepting chemotaxis protein
MFIQNLPIRYKLLSMLILPLFGLTIFSGMILFDSFQNVNQTEQLISDSAFFAEIGATVHNLQKERGSTVAFVSSKGAKMADKLPAIRTDSDKTLTTLNRSIDNRISLGNASLKSTVDALAKLHDIRKKANEFQIDGLVCAAQYTGIIQSLLSLTNDIAKDTQNAKIMRGANTYSAYLNMKERAGRERAILSGIFAIGKMDLPHVLKLSGNLGEANTSFQQFIQIATPEQIDFHNQTVTGEAVAEVDSLRKRALDTNLDVVLGVESAYWFEKSTARIDLMKKVEDKLVADLQNSAINIKSSAITTLMMISAVTLLVILATGFLILKVTSAITHPLDLIKMTLIDVNQTGNYSKKIEYKFNDEIGTMAFAFNTMMTTLQAALSDTNTVMKAISLGNFNVNVNADVNGDLKALKTSVNDTVNELKMTMTTLDEVILSLYNMNFAPTEIPNTKGSYKQTIENAVESKNALRDMLGNIGEVMKYVASGDIDHHVTAEGRGELLTLKENINITLTALQSLNEIRRVAEALAKGDLMQSISKTYPGVFGAVTTSMNNTVDNLKHLISNVHESAEMISVAAKEISAGNNDLSHRTEKQAASLEETAVSMQELTGTVKQNNYHAEDANRMANEAATIAIRGVQVVNSVVTTMSEINDSSHRIVDIISVIDDIAFQTNILALNAAVEAARAGDSGKGFAVVAIEVRNLAQRAANAAGEIKRLIGDSVERVSGGSKQVENAGKTMQEIVTSIREVSAIINEITAASEEQTSGMWQINQAISQMDDVTQQNAALVEQAAAAAESLEEQTRDLSIALKGFKM